MILYLVNFTKSTITKLVVIREFVCGSFNCLKIKLQGIDRCYFSFIYTSKKKLKHKRLPYKEKCVKIWWYVIFFNEQIKIMWGWWLMTTHLNMTIITLLFWKISEKETLIILEPSLKRWDFVYYQFILCCFSNKLPKILKV